MQPPTLRSLSQATIVRTLVCIADDCAERKLLIELFRSSQGSCYSEDVLVNITENFPQQLTDELLHVLAPKHMKHLKMKGCSRVTCDGLAKTIASCSQLNQIDFSGCLHLLHPTVFCCLKDFAPQMTRLIFEDCEIMMDDSVQIILMCCPQLELLNISSCRNITDNAFNLATSSDKDNLSPRVQLAGKNLSSVDISGCQSLTSIAIKNLVTLCGSTLVSINIAWTGVGCIALLYLSGLSQKDVCEFVQQTDSSCSGLILEKTHEDESEGEANSASCANESNDIDNNLISTNLRVSENHSSIAGETLGKRLSEEIDNGGNHPMASKAASSNFVSGNSNDVQAFVLSDSNGLNQERDTSENNVLNQGICDNQNDSPANSVSKTESENGDNDNGIMTDQQHFLLPDDPFLDDELAWQQIDQSCSNDSIWGESSVAVDSLPYAFGEAISCLTNAFIKLDRSDDDDTDGGDDDKNDGGDGDDNDGGIDDDDNDGDDDNDYGDGDNNDVNGIDHDNNDKMDDCDKNPRGNTTIFSDDDNHCNKKNMNLHNNDGDHTYSKNQRESDLDVQTEHAQSIFGNCSNDLADQNACKDYNNVPGETTCASVQGLSAISHNCEDINKEQNPRCMSVMVTDEAKIDNEDIVISNNNMAFDQGDHNLEEMFNFDELTSDDLPSALHGFSDALACLSTAMEDLINAGESSENDVDDDNDVDVVNDDDDNDVDVSDDDDNDVDDDNGDDDDDGNNNCVVGVDTGNNDNHDKDDSKDNDSTSKNLFSKQRSTCDIELQIDSFHCDVDSSHSDKSHGEGSLHGDPNNPILNQSSKNDRDSEIDGLVSTSMEQINLVILPEEEHLPEIHRDNGLQAIDITHNLNVETEKKQHVSTETHPSTSTSQFTLTRKPLHAEKSTTVKEKPHMISTEPECQFTLTHKPQLHAVDMRNIYFHSKALGVACLKVFVTMNKSLNSFATSWSELDDDTLISILKQQTNLRSLILVDCENISDKSLQVLPAYCPKLKKIDLKGVPFITDCGVVPMLSCPSLLTLSLAEASVNDMSMFAIKDKCGDKLLDLDLSWCEDLTDKGMAAIATACTGLRTLALRQCAASFVTMEALSCCSRLTSLNIAGIDELTDQMVVTLATNLPNLTFVDISWNSAVTSIGVGALMLNCCKLQEANLSGLKALSSKPFLPIISDLYTWRAKQEVILRRKYKRQRGKGPVENFIKPCPMDVAIRLGDDLPFRSTTYCPVLRSLILEYSDNVNDDHMAQIVAVCRGTLSVSDYYSRPIEPNWIFFDWTNISPKAESPSSS